MALPIQPAVTS